MNVLIEYEVTTLLEAFGYNPKIQDKVVINGKELIDIYFSVNNGSDSFPIRYKDAIRMLVKGYLYEFSYEPGGIQHIYLYNKNNGLHTDDDRYSCLLSTIVKQSSYEPECNHPGDEIFVNMCDHFKHLYQFQEKYSD